jgi:hypothetical protein
MDQRMRGHDEELSPNIFGGGAHSTSGHPDSHQMSNDIAADGAINQPVGGLHRLVK